MRLLVLGGSGFVGRAVVAEAVGRGFAVTVFNRGLRPEPAGVTALVGDRRGDLAALRGGSWDAVVDTWSGDPVAVRSAVAALQGRTSHFGYVSSRSVYAEGASPPFTEDAPVVEPDTDFVYAAQKRGGELAALEFDGPVLLARAGLILGPYEDVGRLPWWLARLARGGPTVAPGPADLPLQYIDARDLAVFLVDAAVSGLAGPFNLVSGPGHTTMRELLETANEVTGGRAELVWVTPERIAAAGVEPWTQLPIWLPPGPDHAFMHQGDVGKALAAGLRVRPVRETVTDTWAWLQSLGGPPPQRTDRPGVGLDPGREADLLRGP